MNGYNICNNKYQLLVFLLCNFKYADQINVKNDSPQVSKPHINSII